MLSEENDTPALLKFYKNLQTETVSLWELHDQNYSIPNKMK